MIQVGVLHPGEMGAAIARQIAGKGHRVSWSAAGRSAGTAARAASAGLTTAADLGILVENSEVLLSICPPAAAADVAADVAALEFAGIYVDANAISPEKMHRIADMLTRTGSTVLDGSIIGPPPDGTHSARLYLSGPLAARHRVAGLFAATRVDPEHIGVAIGSASALKMAFASYQKPARTLAALAHALADQHGVTDFLMSEADRMPSDILGDRSFFPNLAERAWRWAPEMEEVAATLEAADLPSDLAGAAAKVLDHWRPHGPDSHRSSS